jgi:hypothetical protein
MSSKEGRKVLIIQNDDNLCLDLNAFSSRQELSVFHSTNLYETVRILAKNPLAPSLITGSFKSLCIEGLCFFDLLDSKPDWKCCCLIVNPLPIHPRLLSLLGRGRLSLKQTKEEVTEYISEFLTGNIRENSSAESVQSPGQLKVDREEFLLSPEEIQALLSA